jgi:hypothetical protein
MSFDERKITNFKNPMPNQVLIPNVKKGHAKKAPFLLIAFFGSFLVK